MAGWCSRDVIHIRWTSKRKSATLRTIVLALFDYHLMKHYNFSIHIRTFAWPIRISHGFSPQQALGLRSVRRAWLHSGWTWLAGPATGGCQGPECLGPRRNSTKRSCFCPRFRPMAACNNGKGTTTPWWKRLRRHVVDGHRQDGVA